MDTKIGKRHVSAYIPIGSRKHGKIRDIKGGAWRKNSGNKENFLSSNPILGTPFCQQVFLLDMTLFISCKRLPNTFTQRHLDLMTDSTHISYSSQGNHIHAKATLFSMLQSCSMPPIACSFALFSHILPRRQTVQHVLLLPLLLLLCVVCLPASVHHQPPNVTAKPSNKIHKTWNNTQCYSMWGIQKCLFYCLMLRGCRDIDSWKLCNSSRVNSSKTTGRNCTKLQENIDSFWEIITVKQPICFKFFVLIHEHPDNISYGISGVKGMYSTNYWGSQMKRKIYRYHWFCV